MVNKKVLDEESLENVNGGISKEQFYASGALSQPCTGCGGVGTISSQEGTDPDGKKYIRVKCSRCGGDWKTYID
ncbi:MAG: hypothetical protein IJ583_07545 [Firmicutes bacterium]|nr:hypothetical protein [Bacillota bacterium]